MLQSPEYLCGAECSVYATRALGVHVRQEVVLKHFSAVVEEHSSLMWDGGGEQADLKLRGKLFTPLRY